MGNEAMVRSVYESIICSLTLQIADLKINIRQQEKKYNDLEERYNSPSVNQVKKFDVMASQDIAAKTQSDLSALFNLLIENEEHLSKRAKNCLKGEKIYYIGDLVKCTERDLLRIPNIAKVTLKEIKDFLRERSLSLDMETQGWFIPAF